MSERKSKITRVEKKRRSRRPSAAEASARDVRLIASLARPTHIVFVKPWLA
jgi:hypothetical protein